MSTTGIKNIIFDLGGVLLDIDPHRTIEAFRQLGMPDLIQAGGWGYNHQVFLDMEQGRLSDPEFRDGIRSLLPAPATDEQIDAAWCAMIIDYPSEKVELLQNLQSRFKLYLFSNTNSIHVDFFHRLFQEKFGFSVSTLFVKDYYSHEIGQRKPAVSAFEYVLNHARLHPAETLFIDDSDQNILSARQTGMHTIHFTPGMVLADVFR